MLEQRLVGRTEVDMEAVTPVLSDTCVEVASRARVGLEKHERQNSTEAAQDVPRRRGSEGIVSEETSDSIEARRVIHGATTALGRGRTVRVDVTDQSTKGEETARRASV
jgi:hypothetical protein